jgi:hypothetical protein
VPPLSEVCIKHITRNFKEKPLLHELKAKHRSLVVTGLATDLPVSITGPLIEDEEYWKKCCKAHWKICNVKNYGQSWKRMFFERKLQDDIENYTPTDVEAPPKELLEIIKISSPFVKKLEIKQLLPQLSGQSLADEEEGDTLSEIETKVCCDHLDLRHVIGQLGCLEEVFITYGVRNCGMNFEWSLFEFTRTDCVNLAKAVQTSRLTTLRLHRSQVDDTKGRILLSHLLDHPTLTTLDLSHNQLSDGAGRALGKLLNGHTRVECLDVSDNNISRDGGSSIGHALGNNTTLTTLNLRLNKLGDEGVHQILKSLLVNQTLVDLTLSANNISENSSQSLAEVLVANKTLTTLDLSSNGFGEVAGRTIQEAMEENTTLTTLDLRLTEISPESEYTINQTIATNLARHQAKGQ